ncbi:MAG TPA: 30S ribosomal protein S8e [Thermofilum sp.]|nr:30S ribosomal protein S8e [Thermofilum sp.]
MAIYHGNDLRKITGGKKGRHVKVKRKYWMGRFPTETQLGTQQVTKVIRVRGGGIKVRVKTASQANVLNPKTGETRSVKILKVVSNPSNKDYDRRGVITKGAIIQTELGKAKVISRPGQDGVINAILIEE